MATKTQKAAPWAEVEKMLFSPKRIAANSAKAAKFVQQLLRETVQDRDNLGQQLDELREQLEEAKADALEQLNDRAQVVTRLLARAVPEGWTAYGLRQTFKIDGKPCDGMVHTHRDGTTRWFIDVYSPNGNGMELAQSEGSFKLQDEAIRSLLREVEKRQKRSKRKKARR